MRNILKKLMSKNLLIALLVISISFFNQTSLVQAQGTMSWNDIQNLNFGRDICVTGPDGDVATILGFVCMITNVLSVAITALGTVAFVMFVYASFKWMLAGSNSKNIESARNTFVYAVAGLVLALSSFIILNLIESFAAVNILEIVIPL